ncbi:MAG: DUF4167 domain-containing protein [Candidatus Halichondribacter symbioticus]
MRTSNSKPRQRNKSGKPRHNNSGGNIINRVFDSSGPVGKVRGTPRQIIDKYQALAQDAMLAGDRIAQESFLQFAEHYLRLLGEAQREVEERANKAGQESGAGAGVGQNGAGDEGQPQPQVQSSPQPQVQASSQASPQPPRPQASRPQSNNKTSANFPAFITADSDLVPTPEDND